jgi:hypothetical protein
VALLGALHGLVYIPLVQFTSVTDSGSYVASAEALLDGSYTTPIRAGFYYVYPLGFFDITGLQLDRSTWDAPERQVFRPPGYPLYLAAVGGGRDTSESVALVGQGVLFGLGAFLLALTVRRWTNERLGLAAAALYALDPWSKHYVALVLSETLAGTVALATAYALTRAWQERSAAWWAAAGALAGTLTLVRVVFVVAVPLVALAALLRGTLRERLVHGAAAAAAAAALLVPWLAWTGDVLGRPALASYGEGFNLLVAAHGEGRGRTFQEVISDRAFLRDANSAHRLVPPAERMRTDPTAHPRYVRAVDVDQRERAWSVLADRLRDEPFQVAWETAYRSWFLWNAHEDWYQPDGVALVLLRLLDALLIVLAAAGAVLALRLGGPARAIVVFLLVYTFALGTHHVEARFAMPVRGLLLAFVALACADVAGRISRRRSAAA